MTRWDDRCQCGHFRARHNHANARNSDGPCHWCTCAAFEGGVPRAEPEWPRCAIPGIPNPTEEVNA